jgi:hypothetical protein
LSWLKKVGKTRMFFTEVKKCDTSSTGYSQNLPQLLMFIKTLVHS